ncbi:MAG: hypothetical protein K8U03_10910 [Planctomycetia bacterium]|nr:hypothetical protein [Planctomycetia bacterium]
MSRLCNHRCVRAVCRFGFVFGVVLAMVPQALAEPVVVHVKSGRRFTAEIDPRSDASHLWLRFSKEASAILRPIEWSAITELRQGNTVLPIERVRDQAIALRKTLPLKKTAPIESRAVVGSAAKGTFRTWPTVPASATAPLSEYSPVRSISVEAYLANWDADVESDGLLLSLAALDGTGLSMPINGTLEVELIGDRQPPLSRGNAFPVLARWSRQVTVAEMEASGGYFKTRLEFQALHPEYQLWLSNHALVHVRLLVPGDGAFEASIDAVPMRRFSPVRERAQQAFGTRFLPNEQTGRGHRESSSYGP